MTKLLVYLWVVIHKARILGYQNRIQKITMATTGNAVDSGGDLTGINAYMIKGVISDNTTGLVGGYWWL